MMSLVLRLSSTNEKYSLVQFGYKAGIETDNWSIDDEDEKHCRESSHCPPVTKVSRDISPSSSVLK
jgi:hypothetical protein